MRTLKLSIIAFAMALACANASVRAEADDQSLDVWFLNEIEKLKLYDAEKHARESAAAGDVRVVIISQVHGFPSTPGITCTDWLDRPRRLFFRDVFYGENDARYRDDVAKAAERFNRALVGLPNYPDKDICFVTDRDLTTADEATLALQPERRPAVVDLHTAVRAVNLEAVRKFLANGADIKARDRWGRTPLEWAARRRSVDIARVVLAAGAAPDNHVRNNEDALTIAVETGDTLLVRELLTAGPKGTSSPGSKWYPYRETPLYAAANLRRVDLIAMLIAFEAMPGRSYGTPWFLPLNTAALNGCGECVKLMLAAGGAELTATPEVRDLAYREVDSDIVTSDLVFVRAAVDALAYSQPHHDALVGALTRNDAAMAKVLLLKGQDVNLLTNAEVSRLRQAAAAGASDVVEQLTTEAADRRMSIDLAINDPARIRAIVRDGATLAQDHTLTPLMTAAKTANAATIDALIDLGSIVNAQTHARSYVDRGYALYFALGALNIEAARALVRRGASIDIKSEGTWLTADFPRLVERASAAQERELVDLLLAGATPEQRQSRLGIMLAASADWKRNRLTRLLLSLGAQPCANIDHYLEPLAGAAAGDSFQLFKQMIGLCPDWSPTSKHAAAALNKLLFELRLSFNPLHKEERMKTLRFLLGQKAPIAKNDTGSPWLAEFVFDRNTEVVKLLLDAGADINEIDEDMTALDWAVDSSATKLAAYLRSRGAKTAEELGVKVIKVPPNLPF